MLYKRGKTWWIDFSTPNGERVRRSTQTADRRLGQEYHDRLKAELWRQDQLKEKPRHTWDEAALRWLDGLQNPRTQKNAAIRLAWLQPFLRGKRLPEIDRSLIAEIAAKRGEDVGPSTVNRYLEMTRTILRSANEWGWLDTVPPIKRQKEPQKRIRWLTHEEASRLLKELTGHQKDLAAFALATGLRQRNILELEWSQVDMVRELCWIHPDQAKGGKAIGVPFNSTAMELLTRQKGKHETRVFTFNGKPIGQVNTAAWRKALKRAGISDFRWHDLRHTWASWHVQGGTPLNVLQELGGWSDFKMVQRYAHMAPEHLSRFVENSKHVTITAQPMLKIV
ncbi:MAG: site-specific integrase [Nitrospirota bacterium]|nr:site-specific integrase [Nitrospirota bacterium]